MLAGAGTAGVPDVYVGLGRGVELAAAAREPVEEVDGDGRGLFRVEEGAAGEGFAFRPGAELSQDLPLGEAVDVPSGSRVVDLAELAGQPVLVAGEVAVPVGEAAVLDQKAAEVLGGSPGQLVEGGVVEGQVTVGQASQGGLHCGVSADPGVPDPWPR